MRSLLRQSLASALVLLLCCFSWSLSPSPVFAVSAEDLESINQEWQGSLHALNDVNCSSCHEDQETKEFVAKPTGASCKTCHEDDVETFLLGKHGVRLLEGQSPLQPSMARIPMKAEAHDKLMTCNSCHDVHSTQTVPAATDACLTCHNDQHSLNYENSKHAELFAADRNLPRPSGQSVSCATCHLPRHETQIGEETVTHVNHNNTYTLLPRDRMVEEVCVNCHGVEYSFNSIFDDELVDANFDKAPTKSMETFELIRAFEARRTQQD